MVALKTADQVDAFETRYRTWAELEAGLDDVKRAPRDAGTLQMIVRRPRSGGREVLAVGRLDVEVGLVGDRWSLGAEPRRAEQLTIMSSRVIALLAERRERWPLAGDQLYVDLDLSVRNLPPGTRLAVGDAVVEVSDLPHTGCKKFRGHYGLDAVRLVGSPIGRELQLRGINAWVVTSGEIRTGDPIRKSGVRFA